MPSSAACTPPVAGSGPVIAALLTAGSGTCWSAPAGRVPVGSLLARPDCSGGVRSHSGRPATTSTTSSACEASAVLSLPSSSAKIRPDLDSGWMPLPTSLLTSTTRPGQSRQALSSSAAAARRPDSSPSQPPVRSMVRASQLPRSSTSSGAGAARPGQRRASRVSHGAPVRGPALPVLGDPPGPVGVVTLGRGGEVVDPGVPGQLLLGPARLARPHAAEHQGAPSRRQSRTPFAEHHVRHARRGTLVLAGRPPVRTAA